MAAVLNIAFLASCTVLAASAPVKVGYFDCGDYYHPQADGSMVSYDAAYLEDDWTDPKVWKKENPSLGITVGLDKVKAAFESARQNPAEENSFRQLRLNAKLAENKKFLQLSANT